MRIQLHSYIIQVMPSFMEGADAKRTWTSADQERAVRSTFDLVREIEGYTDKLLRTMVYFVVLAIFVVIIVMWAFLGFKPVPDWIFWPLAVYASFLILYFPSALWNGIRLIRPLRRWTDDLAETVFHATFEILPPRGNTPIDRILNKISELYSEVPEMIADFPQALRRDAGIGKRKRTKWDVAINLAYSRSFGAVRSAEYILVKRLVTDKATGTAELRPILEETLRDLRWSSTEIIQAFIVSTNGFSVEALEFLEEFEDYSVVPVVETETGYFLPELPETDDG